MALPTTVTTRAGLLAAIALLSVSCTDSVGPPAERGSPGRPMFSFSANGITPNKDILAFDQRGKLLIKGFNPTSPHNGDAIIATFYWLGSTNIIDSVVDVMTTNPYTHVGNKYNLVRYVTAGGISMATYVATGVQNFPDGASDPNPVYAVGAYLRDSVVDGGIRLTSWTGVEDVFGQALGTGGGAARSASGSGTVPTVASAGPIAVTPGGLVYGVSVAKPPVGVDYDPAYSRIGNGPGADALLKDDGLYAVLPGGGTANPNSTWFFDQAPGGGTWLAMSLTLNAATGSPSNQPPTANFTSSCSALTCTFASTSSDPDGSIASYSWTFGDGGTSSVATPSHSYAAGGSYTVTLRVTDNQGAESSTTSQTVTVTAANQPPTANFTFSCSGLTCNFTSTSSDPNGTISGYSWTFGDGGTSTAQNPSRSYAAGGTYTVTLRVTDDQGAQSTPTSKTVTVTSPNSPPVVNAGPDQTAVTGLVYSLNASFSDANGNGPWSYRIEWGDGAVSIGARTTQGSFTVGHTYLTILPRSFTIRVTVTDAAGASASDTKVVTVLLL